LDTNNDGTLSLEELKVGYCSQLGKIMSDSEFQLLFNNSDTNERGALDWVQFIMAANTTNNMISKERLREAFDRFDQDNSGYLDSSELTDVLKTFS
jgi:calcium-dependent protein kinase